ncbi:nucleoside/nucleotide kinase family protein [Humisphaera borealis]|uniref:Uncharacterized protein n=1 Tax=Humisphaera borealis TaxID=2807512 RepID=A0A7M2WR39_9BACT|nr:hypothetical protein [Humisphaera borealis]QOV87997.1 hypothetical protein IPV69_17205 [Humisphaera borealis]
MTADIASPSSKRLPSKDDGNPLVRKVVCPHCWRTFKPEEVLWVSEHEELVGDPIVKDEPIRFLPTRFTLDGSAIDAREMVCRTLACPECHLVIPRLLLENPITFFSLVGSVGSGKSNFLAAMTWELRRVLARQFAITFADADKESNWALNRYEELLFLPDDPERLTVLEKTRTQGDLYRSVRLNGQEVQVPKPFLFSMHPAAGHPWEKHRRRAGNIVCLYDNAGEHYAVGQDTAVSPVTRHLSKAKVLMFLFDPTQDPRFREKCRPISRDPQVVEPLHTIRQESILSEAAQRVRKHTGLSTYQRHNAPLLVLVAKSDVWAPLVQADLTKEPVLPPAAGSPLSAVDMEHVERVSTLVRQLLLDVSPEIVTTAEDFCEEVLYIPVSALGVSPQKNPEAGGLVVRPKDIHPRWVTVPILYAYARWTQGLIHGAKGK